MRSVRAGRAAAARHLEHRQREHCFAVAAGRRAGRRDALLVGAFGFLLTVAFSWVPSIWYDEAATITATTRSWPELWRMLGTVDAVHGLYYLLMHAWIDAVGEAFTTGLEAD